MIHDSLLGHFLYHPAYTVLLFRAIHTMLHHNDYHSTAYNTILLRICNSYQISLKYLPRVQISPELRIVRGSR